MAVPIVGTDADDGIARGRRRVQREVDVARPVVRHGHDVDIEQGSGGRIAQQRRMGGRPDVPREQHRSPTGPVHTEHQRGLVLLSVEASVRARTRRRQHPHDEIAHDRLLAARRGVHGGPHLAGSCQCLGKRWRRWSGPWALPDGGDVDRGQDGRGATRVVLVPVRQDEEVDPGRAIAAQPGSGAVVPAGVNQDRRRGGRQQERIALPDVDRGQDERAARGPHRHGPSKPADDDNGRRDPTSPAMDQQPRGRGEDPDQDRGFLPADDGPPPLQAPGRTQDDPERRTGQPQQHRGEGRQRNDDDRGSRAEQRRDCCRRNGDEVGREGGQCDLAATGQQHRQHGDLCPDRDGQQVQQSTGTNHALQRHQPFTDARGDHEHPERGRRRQQQPEPTRQQRIEQHQDQDRTSERMQRLDPSPARTGDQDD